MKGCFTTVQHDKKKEEKQKKNVMLSHSEASANPGK
jgi:hypothetical protein